MKKYVKPTIEVLELRVNENIAAAPKYTDPYDGSGATTPITKYNLMNGISSY